MKKSFLYFVVLSMFVTACNNNPVKEDKNVIKTVGKEVVTEQEVTKELENLGFDKNDESRKDVIENLVVQKMLKQEAQEQELDKSERYKTDLAKIETSLLANLAIEENVYNKVAKDDSLLKKYFEDNKSKFDFEQVKIAHILIKTKDLTEAQKVEAKNRAEKLLDRVKKGENFSEIARNFSEAPDAKWGGEIGYISKGDLVLPIEEVAFGNEIGLYPKIVESVYGYHIIMIVDKKGKKNSVEDLSEDQKKEIRDILLNDYYYEYLNGLKVKYGVDK